MSDEDDIVKNVLRQVRESYRKCNPLNPNHELCASDDIEKIVKETGFDCQVIPCNFTVAKAVRIRAIAKRGDDEFIAHYIVMWNPVKEAAIITHGPHYLLNGRTNTLSSEFEKRAKALDKRIKTYFANP